jgi:serine/threonine protein kinase
MPTPASVDDFLDLVRKSGLVEEKPLQALVQERPANSAQPAADPVKTLAKAFVAKGLLTLYQAEKILEGKCRGFTIDKYKVLEPLGHGGLGNVFLCEHPLTHQRVAVKILRNASADDPVAVKRFYREAEAAAALVHPNIVRAHDVGLDNKLHFLVMDYVDGTSLQAIVAKFGPMEVRRAAHYIRQAAVGLQHAHESGLIHRDIKPANLLVDRQGIVKILDMGIARFTQEGTDVLTQGNQVLGSAEYLAPEQAINSHGVDIRADIYALGSTFYFLLTGHAPFDDAKTIAQKLIFKQNRQPKPVRALRPETPKGMASIAEKMMARDPNERYTTPAEVAAALAPFTKMQIPPPPDQEMPQIGRPITAADTPTPVQAADATRSTDAPAKKPATRPMLTIAGTDETPPPSPAKTAEVKRPPIAPAKKPATRPMPVAAAAESGGWGPVLPPSASRQSASANIEDEPSGSKRREMLIVIGFVVVITTVLYVCWMLFLRGNS